MNLRDDLSVPARLAHYRPTRRSAPVMRAVLDGGARMVIAAYGSGKSLAAGVGGLMVANAPEARECLSAILARFAGIEPAVHALAKERLSSGARGRVAVLSGHVRDVPGALAEAFGVESSGNLEKVLAAVGGLGGCDRVAVIWDEFGRHLEGIVMEGRSRELDAVQRLAEWAVRASAPGASFTLLLHQNVLAYAAGLNQTSRNEWKKVEGRFDQIRFVEDSRELYELVAALVGARRPAEAPSLDRRSVKAIVKGAVAARWFDGIDDEERVERLVLAAQPLSAGALQALPRLVARVGQNERSLFSFIEGADLTRRVGLDEVYAVFSDAMRSDVGIGGTHRRWVEAESARSRADSDIEREAIAAACILQLGVDGERRHLACSTLETAVVSAGYGVGEARACIGRLVARKLLLHRRLNDDVSVWHGADVDLASRLRDERARLFEGFDLVAFLDREYPAPFVRPMRHNVERGVSRYLTGSYAAAASLGSAGPGDRPACGRVVYVLADSAEDVERARSLVARPLASEERTVHVVPDSPVPVLDAALEVEVLSALRRDAELLGEDPLVAEEIDEMLAVARGYLTAVMHRLTTDRPASATWHCGGRRLYVSPERPAGIAASSLFDGWFPLTPRILNDQVMRGSLSRQMETARIRLVMRVMEQAGEPHLGCAHDDTSAEASLYRTVLERTGLHVTEEGRGRFAEPGEVADPGLAGAWAGVAAFFRVPGSKKLSAIVDVLSSPPYGLPQGVIPIIVMAGYKAFARMASIRTDGTYVPDVLGFDSTRMFLEPGRHEVVVHSDDPAVARYLSEVAYVFAHERPGPLDDCVRFAADALARWRSAMPSGARRSRRHTDEARLFVRAVFESDDPPALLLKDLPRLLGRFEDPRDHLSGTVRALERVRNVVDGLVKGYLRDAVDVVGDVLSLRRNGNVLAGIRSWVGCLDVDALLSRTDLRMTDKAVLRTARDTLNGRYSPESLARALSSVLLQRGVEQWQDDTKGQMRILLRECRGRIEDAALADEEPTEGLEGLIEARIEDLRSKLQLVRQARSGRVMGGTQ